MQTDNKIIRDKLFKGFGDTFEKELFQEIIDIGIYQKCDKGDFLIDIGDEMTHIPLIIGGFSTAALQRTAEYGAGWLGFGLNPEMTERMLKGLDAALAEAGRSREDLEIIMMPGDDSMEAAHAFAELGVDRLTPMVLFDGKVSERVAYLRKLAETFG